MKNIVLVTTLLLVSASLAFAEDVKVKAIDKKDSFIRSTWEATCPLCEKKNDYREGNTYFPIWSKCDHFKYFMTDREGERYFVFGKSEVEELRERVQVLEKQLEERRLVNPYGGNIIYTPFNNNYIPLAVDNNAN